MVPPLGRTPGRRRSWIAASAACLLAITTAASAQEVPQVRVPSQRTAAQDAAAARLGRQVTNQEIADAIRRSNLSPDEMRRRLRQAGLDPALVDPFLNGQEQAADPTTPADASFVTALTRLGILEAPSGDALPGDAEAMPSGEAEEAAFGDEFDMEAPTSLVFGKNVFAARSRLFDPVVSGPVDPSYRIGVGDQLQLVLTGEVEAAYQLDVRRDGSVVIPQVGQVTLAGLTLDGARALLRQRASGSYSGIGEGRVELDLSVARIRSNMVFVAGEVEAPGAYQVNALSTVFHALTRAGGPTERGSFRRVEVRRGGRLLRTIDLYNYLLTGDVSDDIRTEQGDVIFVPLATRQVGMKGAVRRPGTFELLEGREGFADLLRFAGGLLPTASTQRLQVDRILPPDQRAPGRDRAVIDVWINGRVADLDTLTLYDGDRVTTFAIGARRRNAVALRGEVYQPGTYEWREGLTLGALIDKAQGPQPWALTDRIQVTRPIIQTGRSENFALDLGTDEGRRFALKEFDTVIVLDGRLAYPAGTVAVSGAITRPKVYPYVERQRLGDLVAAAGGFTEEAAAVEVGRRRISADYSDTAAVVFTFPLGAARSLPDSAAAFVLERFDVVSVRKSPGYRATESVNLAGLFKYPGTYVIRTDGERVSSVVRRAGGLLPTAYTESFRLERAGRAVALSYAGAMAGDSTEDVLLVNGDRLSIGPNPTVVFVNGAVERQVAVPYRDGWGMSDYVSAAGGVAENGDNGRIIVEYASGAIDRKRKKFLFFSSSPKIRPGSTITVLQAPPKKEGQFAQVMATTFQIVATVTSLLIGYLAVTE